MSAQPIARLGTPALSDIVAAILPPEQKAKQVAEAIHKLDWCNPPTTRRHSPTQLDQPGFDLPD